MSENTDVMRKGYDAFAQGDMDTVRSIWSDDIDWQGPDYEPLPQAGHFTGPDEVMQMLGQLGEYWDEFNVKPDEWVEQGDTVIVIGHIDARAKSSGEETSASFAHVWQMQDGKAASMHAIEDTAVMSKALGL